MQYSYNNKVEVLNTPNAKGFKLAEVHQKELVELRLMPGGEVPEHALPVDVDFYVVKGQGTITIDGKDFSAHKGDVVSVDADSQRGWKNNGVEELVLLVIKGVMENK
ncbi:cupin domain-containing protein [Labilibacter sediminis]|nr:cupin domain-containing protein [Labilibacter sediminis]